jgi:hypothetical protein
MHGQENIKVPRYSKKNEHYHLNGINLFFFIIDMDSFLSEVGTELLCIVWMA